MPNLFSETRIYLIGYMSAGKTTIGRQLAQLMDYDFIDTDEAISQWKGITPAQYINSNREAEFRLIESEVLSLCSSLEQVVISTGGGLPVYQDNMKHLLATGTTIYLERTVDQLTALLQKGKTRPLHTVLDVDTLRSEIEARLSQRVQIYEEAHLIMAEYHNLSETVAKNIKRKLLPGSY